MPDSLNDWLYLSEGLNADERDLARTPMVRGYARTSRGGITPAAKVQAESLRWHRNHPLNARQMLGQSPV